MAEEEKEIFNASKEAVLNLATGGLLGLLAGIALAGTVLLPYLLPPNTALYDTGEYSLYDSENYALFKPEEYSLFNSSEYGLHHKNARYSEISMCDMSGECRVFAATAGDYRIIGDSETMLSFLILERE